MTFEDYQIETNDMPLYDDPAIGLAGEVGEVLELIKKDRRKGERRKPIDKDKLEKELGDVLWYLSAIATDYDIDLDDVATTNILKLQKRHAA